MTPLFLTKHCYTKSKHQQHSHFHSLSLPLGTHSLDLHSRRLHHHPPSPFSSSSSHHHVYHHLASTLIPTLTYKASIFAQAQEEEGAEVAVDEDHQGRALSPPFLGEFCRTHLQDLHSFLTPSAFFKNSFSFCWKKVKKPKPCSQAHQGPKHHPLPSPPFSTCSTLEVGSPPFEL